MQVHNLALMQVVLALSVASVASVVLAVLLEVPKGQADFSGSMLQNSRRSKLVKHVLQPPLSMP